MAAKLYLVVSHEPEAPEEPVALAPFTLSSSYASAQLIFSAHIVCWAAGVYVMQTLFAPPFPPAPRSADLMQISDRRT